MIKQKLCARCGVNPATIYGQIRKKYHYCKECKRSYSNEWGSKNKEKVREWGIKSRKNNKEALRIQRKTQRWNIKIEILTHYSGGKPQCKCCGEEHPEFLAIDHINNNGAEAKRNGEPKGGIGFYTYLRKNNYPEGFQVLCHNCNMAKAFYSSCPHKNNESNNHI